MDRRLFLQNTLSGIFSNNGQQALPVRPAIAAGLEKYSGPWDREAASHLLRRAMNGFRKEDLDTALSLGFEGTVAKLLEGNWSDPPPPLSYNDLDTGVAVGETWITAPHNPNFNIYRLNSLRAWWFGLMMNEPISVREKMTLFLHNHFVTQSLMVQVPHFTYVYIYQLRKNAIGNFRTLTEIMTIDGSMLIYLNGDTNLVGKPNENYARELLELFTIGKGETKGPGDYTNYTEADIQAAARVLTGWRINRNTGAIEFQNKFHDKGEKKFSAAFQGRTLTNNGANEYKDLISMIFEQEETARHLARKLYQWFVYSDIDAETENNVITPLADLLRNNNYEMKPVLQALFSSAHFMHGYNIGAMIKSPIDFTVGIYKNCRTSLAFSSVLPQYNAWFNYGIVYCFAQEMIPFDPPGVAGWQAYYQEPSYYRMWVNSVTMPIRMMISDALSITGFGQKGNNRQPRVEIDYGRLPLLSSDPGNPDTLISDFAALFFPIDLTASQKKSLRAFLVPEGLGDYVWADLWYKYTQNPDDQANFTAMKQKLMLLLKTMLGMAEHQLM